VGPCPMYIHSGTTPYGHSRSLIAPNSALCTPCGNWHLGRNTEVFRDWSWRDELEILGPTR
jgi:hypothetical protein